MIPRSRFNFLAILLAGINSCHAVINISCVGDSITAGVGVTYPNVDSYPARLQSLLGTNYLVGNYGLSGATLLKQGDMPYWGTSTWLVSHGKSSSTGGRKWSNNGMVRLPLCPRLTYASNPDDTAAPIESR